MRSLHYRVRVEFALLFGLLDSLDLGIRVQVCFEVGVLVAVVNRVAVLLATDTLEVSEQFHLFCIAINRVEILFFFQLR